ncbi:MAG: ABC transporter substrate-binding protein [Desulfobacterales bacterium]|jgi:phospholipid transport system substrate-binding protein
MRKILIGCFLLLTAIPVLADGDQPIETLRKGVEEGLRILTNPEFNRADRKEAQQQKLRIILKQLFDFREFSRRVLASHWKNFTPAQREAFVGEFSDFLTRFYMGQLQKRYKDETLIYVGQKFISPARAEVDVRVVWKGQKIPVDLLMIKRKGLWKVYDIRFFGFSAIRIYRAQFQFLLRKETPAQVIQRLKMKIEQLEKED